MDDNVVLMNIKKLTATAEVDGKLVEIEIPRVGVIEINFKYYHESVIEMMLQVMADSDTGEYYIVTNQKEKFAMLTHITEDGNSVLLAELKDGHLKNIIKLHLETMSRAAGVLDEVDKSESEGKKFSLGSRKSKALYGTPDIEDLLEQAEDKLQSASNILAPYLYEALVRESLKDFVDLEVRMELQKTLGRDKRFIHPARQFQLVNERGYKALEGEVEDANVLEDLDGD